MKFGNFRNSASIDSIVAPLKKITLILTIIKYLNNLMSYSPAVKLFCLIRYNQVLMLFVPLLYLPSLVVDVIYKTLHCEFTVFHSILIMPHFLKTLYTVYS